MKRIFFVVSIGLLAGFGMAQENNGPLTLRQAIETGLGKNLDVKQSEIAMETGKINWNQARLNMLPNIDGNASAGINQGRSIDPFTNSYINQQVNYNSYGLGAGVVLFNGFSMQNSVRRTAYAYEAAKMDLQQVKDNLTIQIILAYLQVLSNDDMLTQARNQEVLSKRQVERLEEMNKEGSIPPSQLSDLKGQYANDQLSIISAENALESAKISLCQLMNIPYDPSMKLERIDAQSYAVKYEETPASIYQTALKQFAQVKATELRQSSASKAIKVAQGQLFPTLSLNGNVNTNYSSAARSSTYLGQTDVTSTDYVLVNGTPYPVVYKQSNFSSDKIAYGKQLNNNLYSSVSLNLRVPIFSSWQQRNRIRQARLDLKNAEHVAQTTKTQLQQSIDQAYLNMSTAANRFRTLLDQVNAFTESFEAAEVRFNAGVGNSIDYLTAKNNLDRSNINLIAAKYDYVLRTKVLDYYQGKQLW
jgi:outer membrane protein